MKRIRICFIVVILLMSGISTKVEAASGQKHWAYSSAKSLVQMNVYPKDYLHKLNAPLTRNEAAKIMNTFIKDRTNITNKKIIAKDIEVGQVRFNAIVRLIHKGVIENKQYVYPNQNLTREDAAYMLVRLFDLPLDKKITSRFVDVGKENKRYYEIMTLKDQRIITGTSKNAYQPKAAVTIGSFASMLTSILHFKQELTRFSYIYDEINKDYMHTKNQFIYLSTQIVKEMNDERRKNGLNPVKVDPALTQLAIIKATDLITEAYFEHRSPKYGMPWDLASRFNYDFTVLGENLARNYKNSKTVVKGWMNSTEHRKNILNEKYMYVGIGIKKDSQGNYYFCSLFSRK